VRRWLLLVPVLAALAGCGSNDGGGTPAACLVPASDYLEALGEAPGAVRLADATPISECVTSGQESADLGQVGQSVIQAATKLNADARKDPAGDSTLQLGYLVGAVQEGASGTEMDLVRRLDAAARFNEGGKALGTDFERAYGRGYAAGQQSG
jgi:hypothetical protein